MSGILYDDLVLCDFLVSEYWEGTARAGHLREDAPDWLKKECTDFMEERELNLKMLENNPTIKALHPDLFLDL